MQSRANPIRVLIVDDSAVIRGIFGRMVDAQDDMRVVTTATNGVDALEALRLHEVDIVLLDIEMPIMDGLTALPLIVRRHPRARVLVTSAVTHEGASITMQALSLGAVDYVHKPSARDGGVFGVETAATRVIAKIRAVATNSHESPRPARMVHTDSYPVQQTRVQVPSGEFDPQVLVIAASTGGPNAVATVIAALPRDFPLPVLVTQHMPPIFTTMFAQRLAREGSLACAEARDGETLEPGRVYVAPGDRHLTVVGPGLVRMPTLRVTDDPPEHHCRPAADPMFRSAAHAFPNGVLAVVLTGMGDDGRAGCETIAAAGGRIMVQDEASSVVWGMPGSVVASGVSCTVVPLHSMAAQITSLCCVRL